MRKKDETVAIKNVKLNSKSKIDILPLHWL